MTRALRAPTLVPFLLLEIACFAPSKADDDLADAGTADADTASTSGAAPTSGGATANADGTASDDTTDAGGDTGPAGPTDAAAGDGDDTTGGGPATDATDDGGNPSESSSEDGSTGVPVDTSRVVFLRTEAGAPMAYGGLAGADAHCQQAADDAGLTGEFRAWLSATANDSPATRFERGGGPFVRPDGTVIALDWADLVDGTLAAPISVTAAGIEVDPSAMPEVVVATHTLHDGTFAGGIAPCAQYMADLVVGPQRGTATATDVGWTENPDDWSCDNDASGGPSLYCFAQ
jgi:hypothetical protein